MSGLAALRELKMSETTKAIPVIIITAAVSHATTRKEAELGGAVRFLTKPISPPQMLAEIRQVVPLSDSNSLETGK